MPGGSASQNQTKNSSKFGEGGVPNASGVKSDHLLAQPPFFFAPVIPHCVRNDGAANDDDDDDDDDRATAPFHSFFAPSFRAQREISSSPAPKCGSRICAVISSAARNLLFPSTQVR
ncbi:MAG: hypothetical protein LBL94_05055 [Prevotellaceae bacterium]|nr:hypothetical protein [Prevotellaceae bacterium]